MSLQFSVEGLGCVVRSLIALFPMILGRWSVNITLQ